MRDDPSAPDGNLELLRPAARPFPPLDALGDVPLPSWLAAQVALAASARQRADGKQAEVMEEGQDLFALVWPRLAVFLKGPRSLPEVAAAFHLQPAQASAWVRRAVAEGKAEKERGRFPRYRAAREAMICQPRLFEVTEENGAAG